MGAVVSRTTTSNESVADAPPPSVAVQVTVVVPSGKRDLDGCEQTGTRDPSCASFAVGKGTKLTFEPRASDASTVCCPGTVIVGPESAIVTSNDPAELFERLSAAEQVTCVTPIGKVDPDAGKQDNTLIAPSTRSFAEAL